MDMHSICHRRLIQQGFVALTLGLYFVSVQRVIAGPARFWISTSGQTTAGPDSPPPAINLKNGTTQMIYIWAQPMTDSGDFKNLRNVSLNLVPESTAAAVYDIRDTFQIYEPSNDRFQLIRDSDSGSYPISSTWNEAAVLNGNLDSIVGLSAGLAQSDSYSGIGLSQSGDNANLAVKAWLIASVELRGIADSGVAHLHLQIGSLGMNHAGELSENTAVVFGSPSDPIYNAKNHREMTFPNEISSLIDTPDLIVYGRPLLVPGDFDNDSDVDGADFVIWQTNFPKATGGMRSTGDADGNGTVDGADFVVWQTHFPTASGAASAPVPEPAAGLLFAMAALAVVTMARRHAVMAPDK